MCSLTCMLPDFILDWPKDLLEGSADLDLDTARTDGTDEEHLAMFLDDVTAKDSKKNIISLMVNIWNKEYESNDVIRKIGCKRDMLLLHTNTYTHQKSLLISS